MDVEPIGDESSSSSAQRAVDMVQAIRAAQAQWAESSQSAVATQAVQQKQQEVDESTENANISTSPAFSPALLAQEAQYQLMTTGNLGVLTPTPPPPSVDDGHPDDIHAVDSAEGSTISTLV